MSVDSESDTVESPEHLIQELAQSIEQLDLSSGSNEITHGRLMVIKHDLEEISPEQINSLSPDWKDYYLQLLSGVSQHLDYSRSTLDRTAYTQADFMYRAEIANRIEEKKAQARRIQNAEKQVRQKKQLKLLVVFSCIFMIGAFCAGAYFFYTSDGSYFGAVRSGSTQAVLLKVNLGKSIDSVTDDQKTALHIAAEFGHTELAISLIQAGANIHLLNSEGRSALHQAALTDQFRIVEALLEADANPNLTDQEGYTPLMVTYLSGVPTAASRSIAKSLVEAGADVNANNDYRSVLTMAVTHSMGEYTEKDYSELEWLISLGADLNFRGKTNVTALGNAMVPYQDSFETLEGLAIEDPLIDLLIQSSGRDVYEQVLEDQRNENSLEDLLAE
ncbi:MAG: ankyrin repeat domain-containing protein [Verrucomicrobiota bacterium]